MLPVFFFSIKNSCGTVPQRNPDFFCRKDKTNLYKKEKYDENYYKKNQDP
jgi:hypothetical protein